MPGAPSSVLAPIRQSLTLLQELWDCPQPANELPTITQDDQQLFVDLGRYTTAMEWELFQPVEGLARMKWRTLVGRWGRPENLTTIQVVHSPYVRTTV